MKNKKGRLEVITGPAFSGKTEELIKRIRRATYANQGVAIFKSKLDDRYDKTKVVTHNGTSIESVIVEDIYDIIEYIENSVYKIDVVGVDEFQFIKPDDWRENIALVNYCIDRGIRLIIVGLDMNFKKEPFENMLGLFALADEVIKLNAVCVKCGNPANLIQRITDGKPASKHEPVILVGGLDRYEARCRDCYELGD